jgi:hypothetical protein
LENYTGQPSSNPAPVTESQVQDFWTTFPMVYGPTTTPEQVFENMERVLRDQYRHLQGPDEPLLAGLLDYHAFRGRPVLEIGFGTGWLMNELVRAGAQVHGIDLSRSHEALCRHRFRDNNVKLEVASAETFVNNGLDRKPPMRNVEQDQVSDLTQPLSLALVILAIVIATASSDEKLAIAKARGADHLVRYDREPFRDAVKRITGGQGADVVFDPVGGEVFENSMRCINWGARLLIIGFTGGIGLARTNLLMIKGASVLGVRAGEAARKNPALGEKRLKDLLAWAEAGKLRPNVSHRLPLQDYAKAMRLLIERKAIGRVALVMG